MEIAKIRVSGVKAELVKQHGERWEIPAGIVGATIRFEFDKSWKGLTKTVVFHGSGATKDVVGISDTAVIPAEVVAMAQTRLLVGIYGVDDAGNAATPTLWVEGHILSGADPSGDTTTDASLPVWTQLQKQINKLGAPGNVLLDETLTQSGQAADAKAVGDWLGNLAQGGTGNVFYLATAYGIRADAQDNTPALQALVDQVSAKGGGIIFFPVGTYCFKRSETKYAVLMKPNVSIMGENMENTVFKQVDAAPYSMFYRFGTPGDPLTGCSFSQFTVDAYSTGSTNQVYGKAFFFQYLRDCVFRDIILKGTIATAMGIDFLDRVVIDNVSCIDCGRTYTGTQAGTSGIGIGTGGWEHENFTVSNCVCVGSGQFGIFIENQHALGWGGNVDYSKGCVIANCVVRGGLNHGIGVRGGENVTITGCETYENAKHGIYLDNKCRNVRIISCSATANGANGLYLNPNPASQRIAVKGCSFVDNKAEGVVVAAASDKLCLSECYTDGNAQGMKIGALQLNDCVLYHNVFLDGSSVAAQFTGNSAYNDFVSAGAPVSIQASDVAVAKGSVVKINYSVLPAGSNGAVNFVSSNKSIATVDGAGNVTGLEAGNCQITITSAVDPSVSTTIACAVTASGAVILPESISAGNVEVTEGNTVQIVYSVSPTGASRDVTFASSDKTIASVDESGLVTGVMAGSCRITITSAVNPAVSTSISCSVAKPEAEPILLTQDMLIQNLKVMPDGTTAAQTNGTVTDYVDVSALTGSFTVEWDVSSGDKVWGIRVAQYDGNKTSLSDSFSLTSLTGGVSNGSQNYTMLAGCKYIRAFLSTNLATVYNYVKVY